MKALVITGIVIALFWIVLAGIAAGLFSKAMTPDTMDPGKAVQEHCYQNPGDCEDATIYGETGIHPSDLE